MRKKPGSRPYGYCSYLLSLRPVTLNGPFTGAGIVVYRFLADLVVLLHFCFVLFVLAGGFLVLRKPYMAWYHIPAVFWAASIEFLGWICPLTPLENMLRARGGAAGYATGFVEHYIVPILYPATLTRKMQIGLGIIVLGVNIAVYVILWQKYKKAGMDQE